MTKRAEERAARERRNKRLEETVIIMKYLRSLHVYLEVDILRQRARRRDCDSIDRVRSHISNAADFIFLRRFNAALPLLEKAGKILSKMNQWRRQQGNDLFRAATEKVQLLAAEDLAALNAEAASSR